MHCDKCKKIIDIVDIYIDNGTINLDVLSNEYSQLNTMGKYYFDVAISSEMIYKTILYKDRPRKYINAIALVDSVYYSVCKDMEWHARECNKCDFRRMDAYIQSNKLLS